MAATPSDGSFYFGPIMSELDHYDYALPRELIAQQPLKNRADARLLVVDRRSGELTHAHVRDLPDLLNPPDCLVLNDTRVVAARLIGRRKSTSGRWEGLFLSVDDDGFWRIICKTRGKLAPGDAITLIDREAQEDIELWLLEKQEGGVWVALPKSDESPWDILDRLGRVPLPNYIRKGEMVDEDRQHYQTVFARTPGSAAAPTAGLHFTEALLSQLKSQGLETATVTLHVGLDTFRPVKVDTLAEHQMHSEWCQVDEEAVSTIKRRRSSGGRIISVGTTTLRVLETAARGGELQPFRGSTDLFIRPPFEFHTTDALLTNFHLPRSTLLVLVRTFGGDELIQRAYQEAIQEDYRFYSYGDAMLIL